MKPISTADQRRQPTCSPSNGCANAVINKGPAKDIAMASAIGKYAKPLTNKKIPTITSTARTA